MLSVKIETPANHMTEDQRWDYRVTIVFKNSTLATTSNPDEEAFIKELYPDQATYKKEEQRGLRFAGPLGPAGFEHYSHQAITYLAVKTLSGRGFT